jgi:5-methylcytosine-specific restriction endonuclease McrA
MSGIMYRREAGAMNESLISEMVGLGYSVRDAFIFVRAKGCCEYCGAELIHDRIAFDSVQFDHIVPKSKGGSDDPENIAFACKVCNTAKNTYMPTGATREERIQDVRRHLKERRAHANDFWEKVSNAFRKHGYT